MSPERMRATRDAKVIGTPVPMLAAVMVPVVSWPLMVPAGGVVASRFTTMGPAASAPPTRVWGAVTFTMLATLTVYVIVPAVSSMVKVAVPVAVLELGVGRSFALVRVAVNRVAAAGAVLSLLQASPASTSVGARAREQWNRGMVGTSITR